MWGRDREVEHETKGGGQRAAGERRPSQHSGGDALEDAVWGDAVQAEEDERIEDVENAHRENAVEERPANAAGRGPDAWQWIVHSVVAVVRMRSGACLTVSVRGERGQAPHGVPVAGRAASAEPGLQQRGGQS